MIFSTDPLPKPHKDCENVANIIKLVLLTVPVSYNHNSEESDMRRLRRAFLAVAFAVLALTTMTWTALAQQYYQWSGWKGTNVAGIDYRYQVNGEYTGQIQFRNTTFNAVSINYAILEPGANQAQTGSTYIQANNTDGGNNFTPANGQPSSRVDLPIK